MLKLTIDTIIKYIESSKHFEAESSDSSFYIKIEDYTPFVCFAVHNGNSLRKELQNNCLLDKHERWEEEDPLTLGFISSFPIVLAGLDSRYEYDLNRNEQEAIYEIAWDKKVWKQPLNEKAISVSIQKHRNFYRVVNALIKKLEDSFSSVLVFDIHAFNYKRYERKTPVFNIGTELINKDEFQSFISYWVKELSKIKLPNIEISAQENDVFFGKGYLLQYITSNFKKSLVLASEIKKVYCNESTGEIYPIVVEKLTNQLKKAIINTASYFARHRTNLTVIKKNSLLSSELDKELLKVDKQLFDIARDFEILNYVNPVNIEQAKKEFFKSKYNENPKFKYRQLSINPFHFKRRLYALPVEKIRDISLRILYQEIIDSYVDKIDIISSIGTNRFLYNSLRYFGEPDHRDKKNAHYLLHSSQTIDGDEPLDLTPYNIEEYFLTVLKNYGFHCKIEISKNIIAKVLVLNNKKVIRIRKDAMFSEKSLNALAEHEIGVHMLTTINSRLQPLQIFRLGMPINTLTQEGLAILSEYLSGNISIKRLQVLALRVLTIEKLLNGYDFKSTFHFLIDTGKLDENQAFYMTARIFRGGGFTKDYLYLRGFRDILKQYKENNNLSYLLIGKTSVKYKNLITEMIERKIFLPPKYKTFSLTNPVKINPVFDYILEGLK